MRRALLLAMLLLVPHSGAQEAAPSPVERALDHLSHFAPFAPSEATTVVEALGVAGLDARAWPAPEADVFASLAPYAGVDGEYYSHLRVAHAASVSGHDPRDVNGIDYVAKVRAGYSAGQSGSPTFINDDVWAILALRAAGVPASDEQIQASARTLRATQLPDGGWAYRIPATRSSTDVTGAALAALRAAGEDMGAFANARAYLDTTYVDTPGSPSRGGHVDGQGGGANCQSTIWALHGYSALRAPERAASLDYLARLQHPSGGLGTSFNARGELAPANSFCTEEAIVVFAGGRYPLPGYAAQRVSAPECHAREPCALTGAADRLHVVWADGVTGATRTFDAAGTFGYRYHAQSASGHGWGDGNLTVLSARPVLGEFPPNVTLHRHAPLTLDLRNASDPDGRIVAVEVDWGDGNVSDGAATHAYPLPGAYDVRVRARDDAGVWSSPGGFRALVQNRAPTLAAPARVVADRAHEVALAPVAADADADPLVMEWTYADTRGTGAPRFTPGTLGNSTLHVVVTDAYGAAAVANVTVEVVNLAPLVDLDVSGAEPRANASDPDGAPPSLSWTVDGAPASPPLRLAPGPHEVRVRAMDADGATADAAARFIVPAPDEPPREVRPPDITAFEARLADGALHVTYVIEPADARVRLVWRSDAGDGEGAPGVVTLPGATWASAVLVAEHDGLEARRESGLLTAPETASAAASARPPELSQEAPAATVVDSTRVAAVPAPAYEEGDALEPASVKMRTAERQATPAAPWLLAALLAAMLARRARSA